MKSFGHVPAIQQYQEKLKGGLEKNNNGGEVGDEGEPLVMNDVVNDKLLKPREAEDVHFVHHPIVNEIPKNQVYQYQAEYDGRKEEEDGET